MELGRRTAGSEPSVLVRQLSARRTTAPPLAFFVVTKGAAWATRAR